MTPASHLTLYSHPLASYCHKVLIALYEKNLPFQTELVDFQNEASSAAFYNIWPVGKMPVLRDHARQETVPETSIIIEYLDLNYSSGSHLIPWSRHDALEVRKWDRFFDLYIHNPMQKIVADRLKNGGERDANAVREARRSLHVAYEMTEKLVRGRRWAVGSDFSMADCAAAPALFYADCIEPFHSSYPATRAYFERLIERPSFARVLLEARPYFKYFPFFDRVPVRFL